jgi:hypothetical protein
MLCGSCTNFLTGIGYFNAFSAVAHASDSGNDVNVSSFSRFFHPGLFDLSIGASLFTAFVLMGLTGSVDVPPRQ